MVNFSGLSSLDTHFSLLRKVFSQQDVFLVGGAVRDVLLGIDNNPDDIDVTGNLPPELTNQAIQAWVDNNADSTIGFFSTEKYGTATLIISDNIDRSRHITYEMTPFREESGYEDLRHPSEVTWTSSLLLDAGRRDFSVNTFYYISFGIQETEKMPAFTVQTEQLQAYISKQGWVYIPGADLLILQSHDIVSIFFSEGKYNKENAQRFLQKNGFEYVNAEKIRILIDPYNGLQDLLAKKLRSIGEPDKRFSEDALRLLRAVRFVNIRNQHITEGNFDFEKGTRLSIQKNSNLIQHIAKERIHQEIVKVFSENNPFGYIALLDEAGILQYIFPELYKCKNNDQPVRYHPFDTYTHTLLTLMHLQKINTSYLVKLGMLYHDVGKPEQYAHYATCTTKEEIAAIHGSEVNHIISGPKFVKKDFEAIGFSIKEIEEIAWYVGNHMRPGQILEAHEKNQIKKIRLLYSEYGYDWVKNLFDICLADRLGQYNPLQGKEINQVDGLYKKLDSLKNEEGQFTKKDLAINGNDIMQTYNLTPGRTIGELLDKAFYRVIHEKESRNNKKTILSYIGGLLK